MGPAAESVSEAGGRRGARTVLVRGTTASRWSWQVSVRTRKGERRPGQDWVLRDRWTPTAGEQDGGRAGGSGVLATRLAHAAEVVRHRVGVLVNVT